MAIRKQTIENARARALQPLVKLIDDTLLRKLILQDRLHLGIDPERRCAMRPEANKRGQVRDITHRLFANPKNMSDQELEHGIMLVVPLLGVKKAKVATKLGLLPHVPDWHDDDLDPKEALQKWSA
ncbi:MAG: hypothetical protein AAB834_06615, partial [Patescibacteria group bacterium]